MVGINFSIETFCQILVQWLTWFMSGLWQLWQTAAELPGPNPAPAGQQKFAKCFRFRKVMPTFLQSAVRDSQGRAINAQQRTGNKCDM